MINCIYVYCMTLCELSVFLPTGDIHETNERMKTQGKGRDKFYTITNISFKKGLAQAAIFKGEKYSQCGSPKNLVP